MNVDKFIRSASDAVDRWTDKELRRPPLFGGKPGTAVPEVDPEDLKAVWDYSAETRKHNGPNVAIGMRADVPFALPETITVAPVSGCARPMHLFGPQPELKRLGRSPDPSASHQQNYRRDTTSVEASWKVENIASW